MDPTRAPRRMHPPATPGTRAVSVDLATHPGAPSGRDGGTGAPSPVRGGRDRIIALDVLRGMAILGTLATNIVFFVAVEQDVAIDETVNRVAGFVFTLVTNGYWIGLLTVMFGIGLIIQRESAVRRGEPWLGAYPWRAALLIVEGFLNYLFIIPFDVLMGYGLTALVICVVLVTRRRVQHVVLVLGVIAHLAYLCHIAFGDRGGGSRLLGPAEDPGALAATGIGDGTAIPSDESAAPGYWETVRANLDAFWTGGRAEIVIMILMGIGVFLIGARLWEAGLFRPEGARLRTRLMWVGFGIGLPIDWGLRTVSHFDPERTIAISSGPFVRYGTALVVMFGVLALVARFYVGRDRTGPIGSMLVPVGRTALTCYLLQNVVAIVLFERYALNLDAMMPFSLGVFDMVIAFVLVSLILIVFANLWLRRFERGPMEAVTHAAHVWLVRNTTGRVRARRRRS